MSALKEKSEQNLKSADLLVLNKLFSPSVHCSYYSCVQLMLHILRSDLGKSDKDVDDESYKGSKDENGFHNWLQNLISREFFSRHYMLGRDFNNFIGSLKGTRIKADYKNIEIKEAQAKQAFQYAQKISEILNEKFIV